MIINIYFRVLINFIRLAIKKIFNKSRISGSMIQSFSCHTELSLKKGSTVFFKRNIQSDGYCRIIADNNAKLSIGSNTYLNNGCIISSMKSISIGDNCLFGPNVMIFDNNHLFTAKDGVSFKHSCDDINIGNNCWLAAGVIVLKGTTIGDNCVIGAGCKVSGNIPSGSIVTCNTNNHIHKIEDR